MQDPIKREKLYNYLKENELLSMDQEKFAEAYSDPNKSKKIYDYLKENDLVSMDADKFHEAYFGDLKKKEGAEPDSKSSEPTSTVQEESSDSPSEVVEPSSDSPEGEEVKQEEPTQEEAKEKKLPKGAMSDRTMEYTQHQLDDLRERVGERKKKFNNIDFYDEATTITEEDVENVKLSVDQKLQGTWWEDKKDAAADLLNTFGDMMFIGANPDLTYDTYKETIDKEAKKEMEKQDIEYTPDNLVEMRKKIAFKKEMKALRQKKVIDYLEALPEEDKKELEVDHVYLYKTVEMEEKAYLLERKLDTEKLKRLNGKIEQSSKLVKQLQEEGKPIPDEVAALHNQRIETIKAVIDKHEEYTEVLEANHDKKVSTLEALDMVKRNYEFMDNMKAVLGTSTGDLIANYQGAIAYGMNAVGNEEGAEEWEASGKELRKDMQTALEGYRPRMEHSEVDSLTDVGYFISQEVTGQVTTLAQLMNPISGAAGIASLGVSSAGGKYLDMKMEEDATGRIYSQSQNVLAPFVHGSAEALLGALPTQRILKRAANPKHVRELVSGGMAKQLTMFAADNGLELATEELTQLAQNITDRYILDKKDVTLYDHMDKVFWSTLASSPFITGGTRLGGALTKKMMGKTTIEKMKAANAEILRLEDAFHAATSPEVKASLQKQLRAAHDTGKQLVEKSLKAARSMGEGAYKEVVSITQKQAMLQAEAEALQKDQGLSKEQKAQVMETLKAEFNALEDRRIEITESVNKVVNREEEEGEEDSTPFTLQDIRNTDMVDSVLDESDGETLGDFLNAVASTDVNIEGIDSHREALEEDPYNYLIEIRDDFEDVIGELDTESENYQKEKNSYEQSINRINRALEIIENYEGRPKAPETNVSQTTETRGKGAEQKGANTSEPGNVRKPKEEEVEQATETETEVETETEQEPEKSGITVSEVVNRPVTLTKLGGFKLDTPVEGDLYVEGQMVVVETHDGKIYDVGNVDQISDQDLSDLGITYDTGVTLDKDGNIDYDGSKWRLQVELPTGGIEYDQNGNVKSVSLKEAGSEKTTQIDGPQAEEIAYQVLLKEAQSPEQVERINQELEKDAEFQEESRKVEETTQKEADKNTEQAVEEIVIPEGDRETAANIVRGLKGRTTLNDAIGSARIAPLEVIVAVWDGALETVATSIELGKAVGETLTDTIENFKKSDFYKALKEGDRALVLTALRKQVSQLLGLGKIDITINEGNSANYANMTETEEGDFVFYHFSKQERDFIDPSKAGNNSNLTSRSEAAAIRRVGGVSMYYTDTSDQEQGTGHIGHKVIIPKDKVYDVNTDPLNLRDLAEKRFREEHPGLAFDANTEVAYMTKIAAEKGFDMVVSRWANTTRAQTTKKMKPQDLQIVERNVVEKNWETDHMSNRAKGYKPVLPKSRSQMMEEVYKDFYNYMDARNSYGDIYHLYHTAGKYTQEEITALVKQSELPVELKEKYTKALEANIESERSARASKVQIAKQGNNFASKIDEVKRGEDYGATFTKDGEVVNVRPDQDVVTLISFNVPSQQLNESTVKEVRDQFKEVFERVPDAVMGVFDMGKGEFSIDINVIADSRLRKNNLAAAKGNNQDSIYNGVEGSVDTGGNGVSKVKTSQDAVMLAEAIYKGRKFDFSKLDKSFKAKAKRFADSLRKGLKIDPDFKKSLGRMNSNPITPIWDGAIEVLATTIEAGGTIAQGVNNAVKFFKGSDYYKNMEKGLRETATRKFRDEIEDKIQPLRDKDFVDRVKNNTKQKTKGKITTTEKSLLREVYKERGREARRAYTRGKKDQLQVPELKKALKELSTRGRVSSSQITRLLSKAMTFDKMSEKQKENFFNDLGKVFAKADMKADTANLNKNRTKAQARVKKLNRFGKAGLMLTRLNPDMVPAAYFNQYVEAIRSMANDTKVDIKGITEFFYDKLEDSYTLQLEEARIDHLAKREERAKKKAEENNDDKIAELEAALEMAKNANLTGLTPAERKVVKSFYRIPKHWLKTLDKRHLTAMVKALDYLRDGVLVNKVLQDMVNMYDGKLVGESIKSNVGDKLLRPGKSMGHKLVDLVRNRKTYSDAEYKKAMYNVMVQHMDTTISHIKGTSIYKDIVHPITSRLTKAHDETTEVEKGLVQRVKAARRKAEGNRAFRLIPSTLEAIGFRKQNYLFDFNVLLQHYMRQKEYENTDFTNLEQKDKKIWSAKAHMDAMLAAQAVEGYTSKDIERIHKIFKDFTDANGELDTQKVEDHFSEEEMEVVRYIREELGKSRERSMEINYHFRDESLDYPMDYFPRRAVGETQTIDDVDVQQRIMANVLGSTSTMQSASNKRTAPEAMPLDYNTLGTFMNHVKESNVEYHLTPTMKKTGIAISTMQETDNKSLKHVSMALAKATKGLLENELTHSTYTPRSKSGEVFNAFAGNTFKKILIDPIRLTFADVITNWGAFYLFNVDRIGGIAKASRKFNGNFRADLFNKHGFASVHSSRLLGAMTSEYKDSFSSYISKGAFKNFNQGIGGNIIDFYKKNKIKDATDGMATGYYVISDMPAMQIWSYEFGKSFKKITGEAFDKSKFASDPDYVEKHRKAIDKTIANADKAASNLFNTASKHEQKLKVRAMRGDMASRLDAFMKSFSFNEARVIADAGASIFGMGTIESKREALRTFLMVSTRSIAYNALSITMASNVMALMEAAGFLSMYEEDEEMWETAVKRGVSSHLLLTVMGNYGMLANLGAAILVESGNQLYHNSNPFREADYDPYKDSLLYVPGGRGAFSKFLGMLGPEGVALGSMYNGVDISTKVLNAYIAGEEITEEMWLQWKSWEVSTDIISQFTGIPLYRGGRIKQKIEKHEYDLYNN